MTVNEFGIPEYSDAERTVYDFCYMPYITFRNPDLERCPLERDLFAWNTTLSTEDCSEPYEKLARAIFGFPRENARIYIDNYNAFYFLGAYNEDLKPILIKNKAKLEKYKNNHPESSTLKGIHYLDHLYKFSQIIELIDSIKSGEFILENTDRNIFIFVFNDDITHCLCGTLVVNSEDIKNPIASELFLFDSEYSNDSYNYISTLKSNFKKSLENRLPVKLTHICYNVQIDGAEGFNGYEIDCNCPFYSIRTANSLVKIIGFSENSALRARILKGKAEGHSNSMKDMATYLNELAGQLLYLFDYDETTKSYKAKPYKEREACNIAARWDTGRRFLKNYIRKYNADHELPAPIFKMNVEQK